MANTKGRKRDTSLDKVILQATLEALAEIGYESMTMDKIAEMASVGKATIYRRWGSKSDLVINAVGNMKSEMVDLNNLPDTGTLRGDLMALFKPQPSEKSQFTMKVLSGFASMLSKETALSDFANSVLVEPWAKAHFQLMSRAVERGEVCKSRDVRTVSEIVPTLAAYRSLVSRKPFDKHFLVSLLDSVVLPALGVQSHVEANRES